MTGSRVDHLLSNTDPISPGSVFWNSRLPRTSVTPEDALSDETGVECRWDYNRRWEHFSAHKFVRPPRLDLTGTAIDASSGRPAACTYDSL